MIVTISRDYGTAASEVAHELGTILGYPVSGEDFAKIVGERLGTPEEEVEALDSRAPRLIEWILDRLLGPQAAISSAQTYEERIFREIENAAREAAQAGNVIIIGGISNVVLRERHDTLSVYLHAAHEFRIERLTTAFGITAEKARDDIQRIDAAKRRFGKMHYNIEWGTAAPYDLAIDVAHLGIAGSARVIAGAVRELEGSKQAR